MGGKIIRASYSGLDNSDPEAFAQALWSATLPTPGSLSGKSGVILIDLIAPDESPAPHHREGLRIVAERVYQDAVPWIVVAIAVRE